MHYLSSFFKMLQQGLKLKIIILTSLFYSSLTLAVDIAQSPLYLSGGAAPNVMLIFDDSGSMGKAFIETYRTSYGMTFDSLFYHPNTDYKPWPRVSALTPGGADANANFNAIYDFSDSGNGHYTVYPVDVGTRGYSVVVRGNEIDVFDFDKGDSWENKTRIERYRGSNTPIPLTNLCAQILGTDNADNPTRCRTINEVKQNIANWHYYYRTRLFVAINAIAELLTNARLSGVYFGLKALNSDSLFTNIFDPFGTKTISSHNDLILSRLYGLERIPSGGTPLPRILDEVGQYFVTDSAIQKSCGKHFAVMLTDGTWTQRHPDIGDVDGDKKDGWLSDVAKKYYDYDLPSNKKLNLSTLGITFGITGRLTDYDGNGWPGSEKADGSQPYTESSEWGSSKIDDLWHAAYNSRGKYINANDPSALVSAFVDAITFIIGQTSSASAITANSTVLTADTHIYQSLFHSTEWSGDVASYQINHATHQVITSSPEWSAQTQLDNLPASSRKIVTLDTTSTPAVGIPFKWSELNSTQQSLLRIQWPNLNSTGSEAFGQAQLNFLRGDDDDQFRDRAHKLGDIIHSSPVYVGKPKSSYHDTWEAGAPETPYSTFKTTHNSRTPMLYVGANDGMLHAFDATTGEEHYAYIPNILIPQLNSLSHRPNSTDQFSHRYFVDATPTVNDAFFAGDWHTSLVGGLGAGGKGIYALDITLTGAANEEAIARTKPLWEFSDNDDADMGFSFSEPSIVRLANKKWAAIFGNGYNSANGKSVLYIVDIETGALIKKLVADAGNGNGLSTPTIADKNADFIADLVYAGDLKGNVWRFDISDPEPANWNVGLNGQPLFVATADDAGMHTQAITQKIIVTAHPLGAAAGFLLHFGTGKYLGRTDNTSIQQTTQSLYGLWDHGGSTTLSRSNLLEQEIIAEPTHASGETVRVTSDNQIRWLSTGHHVGENNWPSYINHQGWKLNLINQYEASPNNKGERFITKAIIRSGLIYINTLLPREDTCTDGGNGWQLVLTADSGSRVKNKSLDVDRNGTFDSDDFVTWTDSNGQSHTTSVSSVKRTGILTESVIISLTDNPGNGINITDTSTGGMTSSNTSAAANTGRQSWIQLD